MIIIKDLTVRNFMSIGNQTQAIAFDKGQLSLVLGENLDLGGDDTGAKNGTGKTTIVNGLSYALFGVALTAIKADNLVNKINNKNMIATVTFEKNGVEYHIERGRKPRILKFTVNGKEQDLEDTDESQGDSRETQKEIEEILGMSHDMFKHIVALNTYTVPFLMSKAAEQREIIEQLLGISQLSEKADKLKDLIKMSKELIATENTKIETIKISNERIAQSIEALIRKEKLWNDSNTASIASIQKNLISLQGIDIEPEIAAQRALALWSSNKKELDSINALVARQMSAIDREERMQTQVTKEVESLVQHKCHACGQDVHDDQHDKMLADKLEQVSQGSVRIQECATELEVLLEASASFGELGPAPTVIYDSLEQALIHKSSIERLETELAAKQAELNPYTEQVVELETSAMQDINWDIMNDLVETKEHQEFLLKLLTNKDSFIRKRIIDQNLQFLNQRLSFYLNKIGLPHLVEFQNDLSVSITQLGHELDFCNLSRGEMNRLILSLSWAFRDVWENLYQPINLLFIDELLDSGLDSSGIETSIAILKYMTRERGKNIFLISHRDELVNRVNHVLKVVKENGFTHYSTDIDIVS